MGQPDHEAELIAVARPFWDAEAEITRRFFAAKPGREVVANIDATLKQQILDLTQRERIANVHHHCEANYLA